jgi:hypothetical protein
LRYSKAIEVKDHQREYLRKELQQRTQRVARGAGGVTATEAGDVAATEAVDVTATEAVDVTATEAGRLPSPSGLPSLLPRSLTPSTHTSPASAGLAGGNVGVAMWAPCALLCGVCV